MATRAATAGELTKFRGDGQASNLYLAIRKPTSIYTAQLTTPLPTTTDMVGQINYTAGSGVLANVLTGMTMYVGTSAGARDLGLARIRKAPTSTIFYITEISEINWLAGGAIYLTIVDEVTLWAKPIKLVSQVPYMDYDMAYTDQHTKFDPVVLMGPDVVLWRTGSTVSFSWPTVAGSYDPSGAYAISTYSWSAPGSSSSSGMTTAAPTITYNADGQYKVYCTITLASGKSFTGCRTVFVYSSSNMPESNFTLTENPKFTYDGGGWKFEVRMVANADTTAVQDRAKVILFAKDYYQGSESEIGPIVGRENIVCVGWIEGETIEWDAEKSEVTFQVSGAAEWFKKIPGFALGLENTNKTSSAWTNIKSITPRLMLWHLLHWRSTATQMMDIDLTTDTRQMRSLDMQQGSLWQQLITCAHEQILADPVVDRFGSLYVHVNLPYVPAASRSAFVTIMTLTKADWAGTMTITRRVVNQAARVELSGIAVKANTEDKALFSLAPGHVFKHYGESINQDYLLLADQSQANTLAGAILGYMNRQYDFDFDLAMNNRLIDGAPRSYLALTIASGDTLRGITYSGNIIPREIEYDFQEDGSCIVRIHAEQESFPDIAVNGDVPYYPPIPPIPPTPLPPPLPPPAPLPLPSPGVQDNCIVYLTGSGFWYTKNFTSASPTWYRMVDGLDSAHYLSMYGLGVTATGVILSMYFDGTVTGGSFWYCPELGGTWSQSPIPDAPTGIDNPDGFPYPRSYGWDGWGWNPMSDSQFVAYGSAVYSIFSTRVGYSFFGSYLAVGRNGVNNQPLAGSIRPVMLKYGANGSYCFAFWYTDIPGNIGLANAGGVGAMGNPIAYAATVNPQSAILNQTMTPINTVLSRNNPPYLSLDNGSSWVQLTGAPTPYSVNAGTEACAGNKDATRLMIAAGSNTGGTKGLYTSNDFGVTWTQNVVIGATNVSCAYWMGLDGTTDYFLACKLGAILLTSDSGVSWADKTGDLADQAGASFEVAYVRTW